MIILDTNVVSELMRVPDPRVRAWIDSVAPLDLVTTVITRAEIGYGIARLRPGRKRDDLRRRADALFAEIGDRTWPFDAAASDRYGELVAERERLGRPISVPDAQIAAIASARRAALATRNVVDFDACGIAVIDPWRG